MTTLLIDNISELCTGDPDRGDPPGLVRDAALVARDGLIVFAGQRKELPPEMRAEADSVIDAQRCAVLPGFVDSHTHLVWLGERSLEFAQRADGATYESIAAAGGGIWATVNATTSGSLEALVEAAVTRARRMRALGTTTVEIKSGYGVRQDAEMRQLDAANRLRNAEGCPDVVTTYLPLHAAPQDEDRTAFIDAVCSSGVAGARGRAGFVDAFCDDNAFSPAECQRLFMAAQSAGMQVKVHAEQRQRSGGAALAARMHAVSADHLEHANDDDLRALARAGVVGVVLPGAALVLGGPPPPGRRLLEAGARVAVATDCNPGTCYSESMPLMLSLAVATAGLTPAQALLAATSGGAAALRLADRGVLRTGMRCDAVVLRTPNWMDIAYHLGGDVVHGTVVAGRSTLAASC